jgi:hypothetical protein
VIGAIGHSHTFRRFALFRMLAWVWNDLRVPEMKGQSRDQFQQVRQNAAWH